VFLPGAGNNAASIELSLEGLLRKLSAIFLGDHDERSIHCSIGCAVELPETDTFDSLFQRADMALYHVKRNGKNNVAFFVPEMLESDYRFKAGQMAPVVQENVAEAELRHLLEVVSIQYPGIVSFNLTQNRYRVLSVGRNVVQIPEPGKIEQFLEGWKEEIYKDERENMAQAMSRSSLLSSYAQGQRRIQHYYRNKEKMGYVRTQVDVRLYKDASGDVCAFLLFGWDSGTKQDEELQHLNMVLESSDVEEFEYVCLIDMSTGRHVMFSHDGANSHMVPEREDFRAVIEHIRDNVIPPQQRQAYYEMARPERVQEQMRQFGRYSYRYTMMDGICREVRYGWYEGSSTELLMTMHKVPGEECGS